MFRRLSESERLQSESKEIDRPIFSSVRVESRLFDVFTNVRSSGRNFQRVENARLSSISLRTSPSVSVRLLQTLQTTVQHRTRFESRQTRLRIEMGTRHFPRLARSFAHAPRLVLFDSPFSRLERSRWCIGEERSAARLDRIFFGRGNEKGLWKTKKRKSFLRSSRNWRRSVSIG